MTNTETTKNTLFLIYKHDTLMIKSDTTRITLPINTLFEATFITDYEGFLVKETELEQLYVFDVKEDFKTPKGYEFVSLRESRIHHLENNYAYAIEALHFLNWSRKNQYCGVCGTKYKPVNKNRSKKCPHCSHLLFPQTSMAVITGILKDGKILLAHNANFPEGLYSLIAGFVELGESLESAVQREIMEEVGLKVKNIRYFGSQPWPFPNSMMIGFLADYDSGDINTDNVEILEAHWYTPDEFPDIPHEYSIARKIINYYQAQLQG